MKKNATGSRQTLRVTIDVHLCACMTGADGWCDCSCHQVDERAAEEMLTGTGPLCECGKPATHVDADPDVDEGTWACLVPNFDPATGEHLPPVGKYAPAKLDDDYDVSDGRAASGDIKVVILEPTHGRDWTWYRDLRIVAVSPRLNEQGRERAMEELRAQLASC